MSLKTKCIIIAILILALITTFFVGCGAKKETEAPKEEQKPAVSQPEQPAAETPESSPAESSAGNADHEIYTIDDSNALSGIIRPVIESRRSINKGLPVEQKDKVVIGWDLATLGNPWFVTVEQAAKERAKEYGYDLKVLVSDFNPTKQSSDIEAFVSQKVDVIVIDSVDIHAAAADAKRAVDAGIPVIGVGVAFDPSAPVITTVLSNSYLNGFECGVYAAEQLKGQNIKSILITGGMGHPVSESRGNGLVSGIVYGRMKESGKEISKEDAMLRGYNLWLEVRNNGKFKDEELNFELVGSGSGEWTDEGGLKIAEDLLTANPDVNLVLAANDFMGMGALRVIEQRKLSDILIACAADGSKEAMELIKEGKLLCTGYNCGTLVGAKVIDLIHKIFEEGYDADNMPIDSNLPAICINKDNVDKYYDPSQPFVKPVEHEFKTIDELMAGK
jgi:ribose transport system substrate-binding protein